VFADIGSKAIGLEALMTYTGAKIGEVGLLGVALKACGRAGRAARAVSAARAPPDPSPARQSIHPLAHASPAPRCSLHPPQKNPPEKVLHVGDRFTESGNDTATRRVCSICWVANPEETAFFIRMLLRDLRERAAARAASGFIF
jgi:hypothetical protein